MGAEIPVATLCVWLVIAGRDTEETGVLTSATKACERLELTRFSTALVPPTAVASLAPKPPSRPTSVADGGSKE